MLFEVLHEFLMDHAVLGIVLGIACVKLAFEVWSQGRENLL